MSLEWIRKAYGVRAERGGRVEYTGGDKPTFGTIRSARGGHLRILLDGSKHAMLFHPTWELRYLDAEDASMTNPEPPPVGDAAEATEGKRCPLCDAGSIGNCGAFGAEVPRGICPFAAHPTKALIEPGVVEALEQIAKPLDHFPGPDWTKIGLIKAIKNFQGIAKAALAACHADGGQK